MSKKQIKILVAPNSMKGSLNAFDFADVVEKAFLKVSNDFSVRKVPVADGGDFTGEVLCRALNAEVIKAEVHDPLGRKVKSKFAKAGKTAIIEMADASGIKLLKTDELNPLKTSSFGTGQLIQEALDSGCSEIFLGVGGSATVDGGMGMLEALGFQFFDKKLLELKGIGENLEYVAEIRKPLLPNDISIKIICDVDNPLLGENGAATVFGPQKGATSKMVTQLEKGLANWAEILENESGKELANLKGAGAAGGIALPLLAYYRAEIVPGASFILSQLNFERQVEWADLVITGEGKLDSQTLHNKAPKAVADAARKAGKPVIAIGGTVQKEISNAFDGVFSITPGPVSLEESMQHSPEMLFNLSFELAKLIHSVHIKLK
ncbi:glycerate kinase [Mariniphaga sp.]|uniref:glycerate kinase n=1 Tax=Mariniphaga sp. TaxID=1954475 RepID=UPI003562D799